MENYSWIYKINNKLEEFINELGGPDYNYFKYSLSGDLYSIKDEWGLGNLVFAVKILYISNLIQKTSPYKLKNLYESIIKFTSDYGYISDPLITKDLEDSVQIEKTKKAETRQSFAALKLLDKNPLKNFGHIPQSENEITSFLESLNWNFPWQAGSHFSHLLFFLNANYIFFNDNKLSLIKDAIEWLNHIQSREDGTWYIGEKVSLKEKINGAMKILTGLHAAGIYDFKYPEKLIDTALQGGNDKEACDNFNIVYVLYSANLIAPSYRKSEIEKFMLNRLEIYRSFYREKSGGFSFYPNRANDAYYGKVITSGKNEADIHGTIMFLWGISIMNKTLGLDLDYKIPFN